MIVCNVDLAIRSLSDAMRVSELSVTSTKRAPLFDKYAIGGELLYTVVETICNVDAAI